MIINTKNLIKHIKGPYSEYDSDLFENAIYFAEDKKKIIVDGIEYGLDLESDEVDLISNIDHKDNKLTITFSNGKIKEIELEDHRAYWEELPSLEESYPKGGCVINTYPVKEFSFKGGNNNNGKWYSSDGQEGKYGDESTTTITFKEEGEYVIKLVNANNINSLEEVTDNSVKSVLMVGGSNGESYGIKPVNKNENAKLILNNNITSIGNNAFIGCSGFTSLKLPESLTSIGSGAFYKCTGFTSLKLPESLTSIKGQAFYKCTGFTGELKLPDSVTNIGEFAFRDCSGFTGELKLPETLTSIETYAFSNCSGFTGELKLPDSVTNIGEFAFYGCKGFTGELKLPDSLTIIGVQAFSQCTGLTGELVIPESVTNIGYGAFENCTGLSKIYVCEDTKLDNSWNSGTPAEVIKYKKGEKPWL